MRLISTLLICFILFGCCESNQNETKTPIEARYEAVRVGKISIEANGWRPTILYIVELDGKKYYCTWLGGHTNSFAIGPEVSKEIEESNESSR